MIPTWAVVAVVLGIGFALGMAAEAYLAERRDRWRRR